MNTCEGCVLCVFKTIIKSAYYCLKNISRRKVLIFQQDLEKLDHITPVLRLWHWLPENRFQNPDLGLWSTEWFLGQNTLMFTSWTIQTSEVARRRSAFGPHASHIWNKLPENCRSVPTVTSSKAEDFPSATAFHWSNFKALSCTVTFIF